MSLSNPTLTNPAQHFFRWEGSKGQLTWYDKENKKNVQVKLPFEFIVLDELATVTGYSKSDESGIWSNEVRSVREDELYVRTKKGPLEAGLYANLGQTAKRGGKYAASIYIAHKIGTERVIGNFKASGSALSAWIEFGKSVRTQSGKVAMDRGEQQEAPTGMYYPPKFSMKRWETEEYDAALELDRELQKYLGIYLAAPKVDEEAHGLNDYQETTTATQEQQEDFDQRKSQATTVEGFDDEPINIDDIPF